MKLTINLATRRYVNMRLLNTVLALSLVILGGLLVLRVREIAYNQVELGRVRQLTAATAQRPGAPVVSESQLQAVQKQIAFANTLIDRKTMNWLGLLDALEEVVPPGVSLSEITPGQRDPEMIAIRGIATGFSGVRTLVENMEQSKKFSDVYLLSQSETKVGQTQHGTTFSVSCRIAYK